MIECFVNQTRGPWAKKFRDFVSASRSKYNFLRTPGSVYKITKVQKVFSHITSIEHSPLSSHLAFQEVRAQ